MKDKLTIWNTNNWRGKIINHRQAGGIETSTLDNGSEKGVRVAWINTGAGLYFKVVLDRAMDIADAFYNQYSLTWISHRGIIPLDFSEQSGFNWLNYFGGGLVTTCGLTHIGGPEDDESGKRGLHDRISMIPATVESVVQPDLFRNQFEMSITGRMLQSTVFGPHLELKRTISARLGQPVIKICDEVTNVGNNEIPHMFLYHVNFGYPLIDNGTRLIWSGKWTTPKKDIIFNDNNNFRLCKPPMNEHSGTGESVAFIDINPDKDGSCCYEVCNENIPLNVAVRFRKDQLPWLTNWQHWGRNEYVTGLEPGTNPPIGQKTARNEGNLILLQPGESRKYEIEFEINP